ncbi:MULTISPECIES: hypothetical protein [Citrobacter]|uniref:hypothetical protein n=1 Tax=Citrobacter TaxID=544 RepID=UPI0002728D2B|nr:MULTISPECIES: hypothetical protein [Citrobacter]EJF21088.1 hypothetical protein WYG_4089 [Citrobacter sp. A1]EKU34331.1 hypothetical protein B397_2486 [Citrobacter sp. L17]EOD61769.1 hypothetical protein H922_04615 [Citrobacter freundii GTC 09629]MBJ9199611.1 hypothetical protein [Citrobacter freundii]MCE9877184.1 hypothetical protein [Citrobacter freundii]
METSRILAHCTTLLTNAIGKITFYLVVNKNDPTGANRWILVDLSHQERTQPNYVSSLQKVMDDWNCYDLLLFVNSVTTNLPPSLPARKWWLIDAAAEPVWTEGYECFPLLYQNHDVEHDGLHCWVPGFRKMMFQRDVYEHIDMLKNS